jgi:hypothetical protein
MKSPFAICMALLLVVQPGVALAASFEIGEPEQADTRLYLSDGTVVMGHLVEQADDMFILKVKDEIFTFDVETVDKIVTLESLGSTAKTITVTEFPYISVLGGTLAFGVMSALLFGRASDKDKEADANVEVRLLDRAKNLRDQADTARLFGWTSALLAAGSLGVALIPQKTTRRIFPEISYENGASKLNLTYQF